MSDANNNDAKIAELAKILTNAPKIAFLTGAGISTESGVPDFRSSKGVYSMTSEEVFSITYFLDDPERFYSFFADFYREMTDAKPNAGHLAIAELETRCGKDVEVVTQNIDGLHSAAGSTKVREIHGTLRFASCLECAKRYPESSFRDDVRAGKFPRCTCGGALKPDVVFFGEPLPTTEFNAALRAMREAEALVVAGTSLQVYPAAGLPRACDAAIPFVVINQTATPLDSQSALVFHDPIGEILPKAVAMVPGV
ncbi:MAG: NAD-dependent protein deacylase [Thermoguttaceae bacterium]|jgi:NAD-dependent deacetylase